jgi:mono/diheme cytochrome c family protein
MSSRGASFVAGMMLCAALFSAAVDNSWIEKVPEADRNRTNPFAGQADAVAAGSKLFADHCAKCHGSDALGRGKRPSLRSKEVQQAGDGQIFWFLRNGNLRRGMPSWSSLPEPSRWQIIAYLKSLGEQNGTGASTPQKGPNNEAGQDASYAATANSWNEFNRPQFGG